MKYAKKHGYDYVAVKRPFITSIGRECAWLKVSLMLKAIESGYSTIMFVDADAFMQERAPKIEVMFEPDKTVYMAEGYSGRLNSGVIIIKNSVNSKVWLDELLKKCGLDSEKNSDIGWGENGHIISLSRGRSFIQTIDKRWNNNNDEGLDDYIRHFSAGPMRHRSLVISIYFLFFRVLRGLFNKLHINRRNQNTSTIIAKLSHRISKIYPAFRAS